MCHCETLNPILCELSRNHKVENSKVSYSQKYSTATSFSKDVGKYLTQSSRKDSRQIFSEDFAKSTEILEELAIFVAEGPLYAAHSSISF